MELLYNPSLSIRNFINRGFDYKICIETCHGPQLDAVRLSIERQNRFKAESTRPIHENHLTANFSSTNLYPRPMIVLLSRFIPGIFWLAGQSGSPFRLELSLSVLESRRFSTYTRVYLAFRVFPISMFKQKRCSACLVVQIDAACYFKRIPGEGKYRRFVVRYVSTCFISTLRFVRRVELIVRERDKVFVEWSIQRGIYIECRRFFVTFVRLNSFKLTGD